MMTFRDFVKEVKLDHVILQPAFAGVVELVEAIASTFSQDLNRMKFYCRAARDILGISPINPPDTSMLVRVAQKATCVWIGQIELWECYLEAAEA
jgi:hypothetical protein